MTLWRVRATVDDRPGFLAVLAASLALRSINILAVQVHTTESGAVDDFLLDAPDDLGEDELIAAIERGRGRDAWVARTDAHGLVDPPAQLAKLAARVVADPDELGWAMSSLLGGCIVRYEEGPGVSGFGGSAMRIAGPRGGVLVVTRLAPAFTPAEFARAQALAEIAGAVARKPVQPTVLRPATGDDLDGLTRMHARCGSQSLFLRYLTGTSGPSRRQLERLLAPAKGIALVAETVHNGQLIGMANLIGEGEVAEAAVLVEDSWQRKGIGTALLRSLFGSAGGLGVRAVVLHTHAGNVAMHRTVRKVRSDARFEIDSGLSSTILALKPVAQGVRR
jgi:GNAT superfamily N-acetyltransferase